METVRHYHGSELRPLLTQCIVLSNGGLRRRVIIYGVAPTTTCRGWLMVAAILITQVWHSSVCFTNLLVFGSDSFMGESLFSNSALKSDVAVWRMP